MGEVSGGEPRTVAGGGPRDVPVVVSPDGEWLYVEKSRQMPGEISRINLRTGQREPVRTLLPPDPAGVTTILRVVMTPDGRSYAYSFVRALSSLYLVESLE